MDHGTCHCPFFSADFYIHSHLIRGNARCALEAILGAKEIVCVRMGARPENVCIQIIRTSTGIFVP